MATALRITHYRQPGGAWKRYAVPITFNNRNELDAYRSRSFPTEYLVNYPDLSESEEWTTSQSLYPGPPTPPPVTPRPVTPPPATLIPSMGYGGLPVASAGAAEPNPPRFTAPGRALAPTLRSEVAKIVEGTTTRASVTMPAPAEAPRVTPPSAPRLLVRSEISAPEPNPPRLYSPLEFFPIPGDTVSTGPEPNPPALYRAREFYPVATAAEPNPPRLTATVDNLLATVRQEVVKLSAPSTIPRASVTTPSPATVPPPRAAPPPPPAPDPPPILADAQSDWDLARELFGEWWTKPGIWDQVRARFGGQLPENPDRRTPHGTDPTDNPSDDGTDPTDDMPDDTNTPTDSSSTLDSLLNGLNTTLGVVGKLVDAFNPTAPTSPPPTATPQKPAANASFIDSQPWYVWGGLGLLLLLLLGKKR